MFDGFLTWWMQQLAAALPSGLSGAAGDRAAVVVREAPGGLVASLRRRGREQALGELRPGGAGLRQIRARRSLPVLIGISPAALLQQPVGLPLAAERDLDAVLTHEMDRLTPFPAADIFWTWRVLGRDRAAGRLTLQLTLVPKMALATVLEQLQTLGIKATAIAAGSEIVPFRRPGSGSRGQTRAAAGVCAALLVAAAAIPFARQQLAINEAANRTAALQPDIETLNALRRRLDAGSGSGAVFAAERARTGDAMLALAALTAALPDDTYLLSFAMRERHLTLAGRSAAAPRLIAALSADPALRDAAFDAPVTRGADRTDVFSIRATLAP